MNINKEWNELKTEITLKDSTKQELELYYAETSKLVSETKGQLKKYKTIYTLANVYVIGCPILLLLTDIQYFPIITVTQIAGICVKVKSETKKKECNRKLEELTDICGLIDEKLHYERIKDVFPDVFEETDEVKY